jgi:hypothetical protein
MVERIPEIHAVTSLTDRHFPIEAMDVEGG